MRISTIFFILIFLSLSIFSQGWELYWADEFDGGELNEANWKVRVADPYWVNSEQQRYTAGHDQEGSNIFVEDGYLILEARRDGGEITSGRVYSEDLQSFQYGRMEASMRLPTTQGYWPAFWMLGWDINKGAGWPACGEIDIMEGKGSEPYRTSCAFHSSQGTPFTGGSQTLSEGNVYEYFHTYAIEWSTDTIRWYVDDNNFHTFLRTDNPQAPVDKEYYFIINLAVGGHFDGNVDETTVFPDSVVVDYVRVYKWNEEPAVPEITSEPEDKEVSEGSGVVFSVNASGGPSYQWYRDGAPLTGETEAGLSLQDVTLDDNGAVFHVIAVNDLGSDTSREAVLTVVPYSGPVIEYTSDAPVIDGEMENIWSGKSSNVISNIIMGTVSSDTDLSGNFSALWDEDNLYLFAQIVDDIVVNPENNDYQDDGIEIYIDLDNSKSSDYGDDDYQLRYVYGDNQVTTVQGSSVGNIESAQTESQDGYVMEISIPWSELGGSVQDGHIIGFDFHVNDNDGSGREGKMAWYAESDNSHQTPSAFGSIKLATASSINRRIIYSKINADMLCEINRTGSALTVSFPFKSLYRAALYGINGREVIKARTFDKEVSISTQSLSSGSYILSVFTPEGKVETPVVICQ